MFTEWRPGYVKPSSQPAETGSSEIPDMFQGVMSSNVSLPSKDIPGVQMEGRTGNTAAAGVGKQRPESKDGSQEPYTQSEVMV